MAITNVPTALYLSAVHQRGAVDVMHVLSKEARNTTSLTVLFLMPCHSTPFYSHVPHGFELIFLDCSPEGFRPAYSLDMQCASQRHTAAPRCGPHSNTEGGLGVKTSGLSTQNVQLTDHVPAHTLGRGPGRLGERSATQATDSAPVHGGKCAQRKAGKNTGTPQHGPDEADRFFEDPQRFLDCAFQLKGFLGIKKSRGPRLPTHVVAFAGTVPSISRFRELPTRVVAFHEEVLCRLRVYFHGSVRIWCHGLVFPVE